MLRNLWYVVRHFKGRHARHGHMAELEYGERESGEEPPLGMTGKFQNSFLKRNP